MRMRTIQCALVALTVVAVSTISVSDASAQWLWRWRRCCCYPAVQMTYTSYATPCCGVTNAHVHTGYSNQTYGMYDANNPTNRGYMRFDQRTGTYIQAPGYSEQSDADRFEQPQDRQRFRPTYDQDQKSRDQANAELNASGQIEARGKAGSEGDQTDIRANTELKHESSADIPKVDDAPQQVPEPNDPPVPR